MTFVPAPGYMPAYNPPLPYVAPVLGGLQPGMAVYVQGVVAPQPDWFRVNLATGPEEEADVALHLNPRFSGGVAVLNSRRGGDWVTLGDTRFRVNLATGPEEEADVALHLNPRFSGGMAVLGGTLGFRVNLATGPEEEADVALHLNPRFSGGVAVLNSRRGGRWGDERRRELHPLCPGGTFEMVISVTPEAFRILVNGTFYDEFPHRLPPEQVTAVTVDGDLELHSASVMGGGATCPPCVPDMPQTTPTYPDCNLPVMGQPPTLHPPVPFIATIPGGLVPKKTIVIKGFIPHDANRFHVNLRAGPGGDVVLHVNPRMNEDSVVRNAHLGGSWGHEERELGCCSPFQRGRYFDLSIRCGNHRFKVFAEGQPLFDFQHRVPAGPHVDMLEIEGDVVLSYVHF